LSRRPAYFPETSGLQLRAPRKSCRHLRRLVFSPRLVEGALHPVVEFPCAQARAPQRPSRVSVLREQVLAQGRGRRSTALGSTSGGTLGGSIRSAAGGRSGAGRPRRPASAPRQGISIAPAAPSRWGDGEARFRGGGRDIWPGATKPIRDRAGTDAGRIRALASFTIKAVQRHRPLVLSSGGRGHE